MARKDIMLAKPINFIQLERWDRIIAQPKINGIRCRAVIQKNGSRVNVSLFSSEANEIISVPHISNELANAIHDGPLSHLDVIHLDGELYRHGMALQDIRSITGRTVSRHVDSDVVEYHIFDIIDARPQYDRTAELELLAISMNHGTLRRVPSEIIKFDHISDYIAACMKQGFEGAIFRHPDGLYQAKRTGHMFKCKPRETDTYRIIGVNEEISIHGEPKNALGSFICEKDGETFKVGSGSSLTRDNRIEYWKNREQLTNGQYVAVVKYQNLTNRQVPYCPVVIDVIKASNA
uniref:Putative DNA ligase domain protein n=1 Tax=viral metagenome TaxID=1070528 RepID=A0A6M3LWR6_9ZZZZ